MNDNSNDKTINLDKLDLDDHMKTESPLICHVHKRENKIFHIFHVHKNL